MGRAEGRCGVRAPALPVDRRRPGRPAGRVAPGGVAARPAVPPGPGLADAGRGRPRAGAPLVVHRHPRQAVEHPVIVIPSLPLVDAGPYRLLRHPNYVAVVAEGVALPLVHTCWLTALLFTVVNLGLLRTRVKTENAALRPAAGSAAAPD